MVKYENSKIYKLVCGDLVFVDCTCQDLNTRLAYHNYKYRNGKEKASKLFESGEPVKIELIEEVNCQNKKELKNKVQEYKNTIDCINKLSDIPINKDKYHSQKKYYKKHREEILTKNREYQLANKDELKERCKKYYEENKERITLRNKKYNEENKNKVTEIRKAYGEKNKQRISENKKEYYKKNREHILSRVKQYQLSFKKTNPDIPVEES
jgi:hypothetical protein